MKNTGYTETLSFLFIAICVLCYSVGRLYDVGSLLGCAVHRPAYTLLSYPFFHVSFIHLFLNMLVFGSIYPALAYREGKWKTLATGICLSALAGWITAGTKPVLGASGLNYVFLGWIFAIQLKEQGRGITLKYGALLLVSLVAGLLHPEIQGSLHVAACTGGFIYYYMNVLFSGTERVRLRMKNRNDHN